MPAPVIPVSMPTMADGCGRHGSSWLGVPPSHRGIPRRSLSSPATRTRSIAAISLPAWPDSPDGSCTACGPRPRHRRSWWRSCSEVIPTAWSAGTSSSSTWSSRAPASNSRPTGSRSAAGCAAVEVRVESGDSVVALRHGRGPRAADGLRVPRPGNPDPRHGARGTRAFRCCQGHLGAGGPATAGRPSVSRSLEVVRDNPSVLRVGAEMHRHPAGCST